MEYLEQALRRLEKENKTVTDRYGAAMKDAVRRALESFARQDEEFAQAIAQGGSFADCMKQVSGGVKGGAISDLDAYRRAVEFYFPGAVIRTTMEIDVCPNRVQGPDLQREQQPAKVLDLSDFL